jgi:O-antigen/teichoic acid export membrane protein
VSGHGPASRKPDSIGRNASFALLVQGTTTAFTAITTLVLVRVLGPDGYGVFALALGIAGITGVIARFGIPTSVGRFLAERRDDPAACASLLRDALRLNIVSAGLACTALFLAAAPLAAAYDEPGLTWPLRAFAISLFAETLFMLYVSAFVALARIAVNFRLILVESTVETTATVALVAVGAGVTGAAFGRAVGYAVGLALAVGLVLRLYGRITLALGRRGVGGGRTRELARYALPLFAIDVIFGLYARIDVILIGALLGTTAVGVYAAPGRLIPALESVALAVSNSVAPRQAVGADRNTGAFPVAVRWLMILYAAAVPPIVVWAEPISDLLFGSEYGGSADVLRAMAPFVFLNGLGPLSATTVNYLGFAGRRVPIALTALVVSVAWDIAMLPVMGPPAAALGAGIALAIYVPAHLVICQRHLRFPVRPLVLTLLRAALAAAAAGGVLALAGVTSLTPAAALLGIVGGVVTYLGVLLATRELKPADVRRGRDVARRLTSGRR